MGPTLLGGEPELTKWFLPLEGILMLETFAGLGLTYYMFILGLEIDLPAVMHMSKQSLTIGAATILFPLAAGAGLYFLPLRPPNSKPIGALFWAVTFSITSYPDLARLLSDFKILHTDLGTTALSTALLSDVVALVLLLFAVVTYEDRTFYTSGIPTLVFFGISWFLLRPLIDRMIKEIEHKGGKYNQTHIYIVLAGVAMFGAISDASGSHSMIGGFVLGVIFPKGVLASKAIESIQEFVEGIMMPAFLMVNGMRTNIRTIPSTKHVAAIALIAAAGTSAKLMVSVVIYLFYGMSVREGLTLGTLLNSKGILALFVLNEGKNLKALDNPSMTVMNTTILFMSILVGPTISVLIKRSRRGTQYKLRTVSRSNPDSELRILTCIHSVGNISGIVNLLQRTNSSRTSPLRVFATRLVELTGRAATMLVVHEAGKTKHSSRDTEADQIFTAFENYKKQNPTVSVHPLTIVSPYSSMHEDIVQFAEDKLVAMILIPFHKKATVDGGLQVDNHSIMEVNHNLQLESPCTLALLVDRGLGLFSDSSHQLRVAMFFISGFDDREALTYACRLAGTPNVTLTVVRFLQKEQSNENFKGNPLERENDKEDDDEFINDFRFRTMLDKSIIYYENQLINAEEMVESLKTKYSDFDLYVVGRGLRVKSRLIDQLSELSDNPALGPMGDMLITSSFSAHASVLVVQQPCTEDGITSTPTSSKR